MRLRGAAKGVRNRLCLSVYLPRQIRRLGSKDGKLRREYYIYKFYIYLYDILVSLRDLRKAIVFALGITPFWKGTLEPRI